MSTLEARTAAVEDRTDRLELLFERFMAEAARDREEAARYREEAARYREEAARYREEAARNRAEDRAEAARDRAEAARDRKEMNRRWGELANKMGTVVQGIVAPSLRRIARDELGCGDERSFSAPMFRVRSDDPHRRREFDALYVGTRAVLLNETKSTALSEYARAFVEFLKSGEFALYFPEYRELPLVAVFSSLRLPDDVITCLTRNGIYAVSMGEETMQVRNRDAVAARRRMPPTSPAGPA